MAISNLHALSPTEFAARLRALMLQLEASSPTPYFDTADIAKITIGIGFNIDSRDSNRADILDRMDLSPVERTAIDRAFESPGMAAIRAMAKGGARDAALLSYLSSALGRNFAMTQAQIDAHFSAVAALHAGAINPLIATSSLERMALTSLRFNHPRLIGNGLKAALAIADPYEARAEAWYQIRYVHADQLHKRRAVEAAIFGLYGDGASADPLAEARAIYRMYTSKGDKRLVSAADMVRYDQIHGTKIADAQGELNAAGLSGIQVRSLREELRRAADVLKQRYIIDAGIVGVPDIDPLNVRVAFDGRELRGENTVVRTGYNADLLIGHTDAENRLFGLGGNDVLVGGSKNDTLEGGAGDDVLVGGVGDDTYVFKLSEGVSNDRIIDSDGKGRIVVIDENGVTIETNLFERQGSTNVWLSKDSVGNTKATISHNSPWRITLADGSVIELGNDFDASGFGITLVEEPADPSSVLNGGFIKKLQPDGVTYAVSGGNYVADGVDPNAADLLFGGSNADEIQGGAGNDGLAGNAGNDQIDGGDGSDVLLGGSGSDRLLGGAGDDFISGSGSYAGFVSPSRSTDAPPTAQGTELARGFGWVAYDPAGVDGNGIDTYVVTMHTNQISGDGGSYIDAGAGNDRVDAGTGDDVVRAGSGHDQVHGMHGADVIYGDDGDDRLWGDSAVLPGYLTTTPAANHGDDLLVGGQGNDILVGQGGDDELQGGSGNDKLWGDDTASELPTAWHGNDTLDGDDGDDEIQGGGGDDRLSGGEGNDLLWGDATQDRVPGLAHGADLIDGGGGDDMIAGAGGADVIYGGAGDDEIWGDAPFEHLSLELHANDYLYGGEGDDYLDGTGGEDVLFGGEGSDVLYGGAGNDVLNGGAGADYMNGEEGDDTYVVSFGDSTPNELGYSESIEDHEGRNVVVLESRATDTLSVRTDGQGQLILGFSPSDSVVIVGGASSSGNTYQFDDGSGYSYNGLVGKFSLTAIAGTDALGYLHVLGGQANDTVTSGSAFATLSGGRGNDRISASGGGNSFLYALGDGHDIVADGSVQASSAIVFDAGIAESDLRLTGAAAAFTIQVGSDVDDAITFGSFDQTSATAAPRISSFRFADGSSLSYAQLVARGFDGDAGHDNIAGTAGNDRIDGHGGNDTISGGSGNDTLVGGTRNDDLSGNDGADILDGGEGDDTLRGGNGADVYLFGFGAGRDTVLNADGDAIGSSPDMVQLASGIEASDVVLVREQQDLVLRLSATDDRLRVKDFFVQDGLSSNAIDSIVFTTGPTWTVADIKAATIMATPGSDNLTGYASADAIFGADGNDAITGNDGNDSLSGGIGEDTLTGGSGSDVLNGATGNDNLSGDIGNDTLDGGAGDDYLRGGAGADFYLFGFGSGRDLLDNYDTDAYGVLADTVLLGAGITASNITLSRHGTASDLYVGITGTDDVLTISGYFASGGASPNSVEVIQLADGTPWAFSDVEARVVTLAANQSLSTGTSALLTGGSGDDSLYGSYGNDTLDGGLGDDYLYGSGGSDTFRFGVGAGADYVDEMSGANDVVLLGAGLLVDDVELSRSRNDLIVSLGATVDRIQIRGYFAADPEGVVDSIEQIRFADATTWDRTAINGRLTIAQATPANDNLFGGDSASVVVDGLAGADYIVGSLLNDTLGGGDGEDTLYGSAGDDVLSGGAQNDVLFGGSGHDALSGGAGDDTLYGDAGDNILDGGAGSDTFITTAGCNRISFGYGSGRDNIITGGSSTDNTIVLDASVLQSDVILSTDGLRLRGSSDVLLFSEGVGSIELSDGSFWTEEQASAMRRIGTNDSDILDAGTNVYVSDIDNNLRGLAGDDLLYGRYGDDFLEGGDGADLLYGGQGIDYLFGDAQSDNLFGEDGADHLIGGTGDDTLLGGWGSDVYVYEVGDGNDTIAAEKYADYVGEIDTLQLGDGISTHTVQVHRGKTVYSGSSGLAFNDTDYLVVSGLGAGGDVAVQYFFGLWETDAQLHEISFDDGAVWDRNIVLDMINAEISTGTAASDVLLGTETSNRLSGLEGDDSLVGGVGNDWLDGGVGADTLIGGDGNDVYLVDSVADVIQEAAGEGSDTVESLIAMTLGDNLENLRLIGSASINATGNAATNVVTGNTGANVLNGGGGTDTLTGRQGDDVYVIGATGVTIVELIGEGFDTVLTSISWALEPQSWTIDTTEIEGITLTGDQEIDATGNELANVLIGNIAANRLDGSFGTDTMRGGAGDDTYVVDRADDVVVENAGEGTDLVLSSSTFVLAANIENLTLIGSADVGGTGNEQSNFLVGNSGANLLYGAGGADTLAGGAGNDTYVLDSLVDLVSEAAGEGTDLVQTGISYILAANVENLTLTGGDSINATGNTLINVLRGNSGANLLDGGAGADTLIGGVGDDTYIVDVTGDTVTEAANEGTDTVQSAATYTLGSNIENLVLTGSAAINGTGNTLNNVLTGNGAANTLTGGNGNDTLAGGAGIDTLVGGSGDDIYVVDAPGDVTTEASSAGTDTVRSTVTWTLASNLERLELLGTAALDGTGNTAANRLTGNAAANLLDGGSGADTLIGGAGDDTYVVDNTGDVTTEVAMEGVDLIRSSITWTLAAELENLTLTGTSAINGTGNGLVNTLTGNSVANVLNGGAGDDIMAGGAGNDTYVVDSAADAVVEASGAGTDLIQSSIAWTLGANVENLTLTGSTVINGAGNELNNTLTGNAADNVLDGGLGNDTLVGGAGNDSYVVDSGSDVVTEAASAGTDTVLSSITLTLASNVENLTLTGLSAINGTGNTLNNVLRGNAANNTLSGGTGSDSMIGGAGSDTYVVDATGDSITELVGEGTDLVQASVTYTLAANVENLSLTGTTAISGTGNALDNQLTGNSANNTLTGGDGNDVLDGGTGNDTMVGGVGDDVYKVNVATDVATEAANAGRDRVESSVTLTLASNVEDLALLGTSAINGTGNTLDNVLTGNSAANSLTGGVGNDSLNGNAGVDTLVGGAGNDLYFVDNTSDVTTEAANEGTDTVNSTVTWTLGSNLENLTLTGTSAVNGIGNTLNNSLIGNSAANTLTGNAGNDTLDGGAAADTLVGGAGNDKYMMGLGYGAELVQENDASAGNIDLMQFMAGVATDQIWFRKLSNDLEVSIIGTTDKATVQNWYLGNQYHVEQFKTSDGKTLLDSKVQDLVSAMASFTPPAVGQTTLPASYQSTLLPVIAANWGP